MCGNTVSRYLLWVSYDGARFLSIANRSANHGVLNFLRALVRNTFPDIGEQLKMSPSSRTDAGVHALRNAFIVQIPTRNADERKFKLLNDWNEQADEYSGGSLRLLDFHAVSNGFCSRRNVSYRKYKYRLAVADNEEEWLKSTEQPSLWQFAERPYLWFLPNGFDVCKAADACSLFQIRHMVRAIVDHAYGALPRERLLWLLDNPNPENFHNFGMVTAPAQGLFLEDVVYDERMFHSPVPYYYHSWDDQSDQYACDESF